MVKGHLATDMEQFEALESERVFTREGVVLSNALEDGWKPGFGPLAMLELEGRNDFHGLIKPLPASSNVNWV